jgi:hypothetical protein
MILTGPLQEEQFRTDKAIQYSLFPLAVNLEQYKLWPLSKYSGPSYSNTGSAWDAFPAPPEKNSSELIPSIQYKNPKYYTLVNCR